MPEVGVNMTNTSTVQSPVVIEHLEYPTQVVAGQEFTIRVVAKQVMYTYGTYGFGIGYHQGASDKIKMENFELARGVALRWSIQDRPGQIIEISVRVILPLPGDHTLYIYVHPSTGFQILREIKIHALSPEEWALGSMMSSMASLISNMFYIMIMMNMVSLILGFIKLGRDEK